MIEIKESFAVMTIATKMLNALVDTGIAKNKVHYNMEAADSKTWDTDVHDAVYKAVEDVVDTCNIVSNDKRFVPMYDDIVELLVKHGVVKSKETTDICECHDMIADCVSRLQRCSAYNVN